MAEPVKLSAADLEGAEELPGVRLSPDEIAGAQSVEAQPEPRSFLRRAVDTVKAGAHAVGHVASEGIQQAERGIGSALGIQTGIPELTADQKRARATELVRGVDDMTSLGYGQKGADAARRALGLETPEQQEAARAYRAQEAPEYRTVGQLVGNALPGASTLIGKGTGTVLERAGTKIAPLLGRTLERVAKTPIVGPALSPVVAGAAGAAKGIASYEAAAPLTAALSANAAGHRHEALHEAAGDPLGLVTSATLAAIPAYAEQPGMLRRSAEAVQGSRGAEARRFIEERGGGAKVGLTTEGSGGVFDRDLRGVPATEKGIGMAAKRGAIQIADTIEQQFADKHGFGYREGGDVVKESAKDLRGSRLEAAQEKRAAAIRYRDDIRAAEDAVKTDTASRARQIIDHIDHEHAVETSRPYRVLKEMIDNSPASATPRDVAPIVAAMQDAAHDLETAPFVRSQLNEQLTLLERYRDPKTGAVLVPERQLNGLRRTLMRSAKIGMNDAPGEAMAPLRKAAFEAKRMVDEGPYKSLNDLYAEGTAKREASRQAVGLGKKPPKDKATDEKRLVGNLRRSVDDQTAIPGPLPPEADVSHLRAALEQPERLRDQAMADVRRRLEQAEARHGSVVGHVAAAQESAGEDRALLGLNRKIGTRKTDVNQVRIALERQGGNSLAAGGNPSDLAAFRAAHPELGTAIDLPELQRAKADLTFGLLPGHGGLPTRIAAAAGHPAAVLLHNAKPIAGRVLYKPTARYLAAVDRLAKVARAATSASAFIREAVAAGLGVDDARKIYEKAHPAN